MSAYHIRLEKYHRTVPEQVRGEGTVAPFSNPRYVRTVRRSLTQIYIGAPVVFSDVESPYWKVR